MTPFWINILKHTVLRKSKKNAKEDADFNTFQLAKAFREFKITALNLLRDAFLIVLGIFSAALGLEGFLLPNQFIDGGATGIALLITIVGGLSLPILLIIVNIPFVALGYRVIGRQFAVKTSVAIVGLALVTALIHFPVITQDRLLISVFGGFFLGTGIGLAVRGGAVLDGTEILAIYLSKKAGTTIGDIIVLFNVIIFAVAAYFLTVEIALYSMITYLAASKTVDFVIEGIEEYIGVTIVSRKNEKIREMIISSMGRGVTIYKGHKGYGKSGDASEIDIIYTVITRLEISKLNTEIEKIDPRAFIVMNNVKDTKGGMIKKRRLKH